ncbi:serine/threonine-protein kinase [Roseisolibacter sp. H3M3-2]|uniref:serine/threonine-protein kinase n=1 Tax=Roseisolibacter sp. H3M3-2 TaxID=3031323 RepID=UPI0023DAF9F3|nr:serine/threonine-protein kinase [Roseisolibacter sp. H3M3-2]MDF1502393.1 serine/threonine-protein kinase [Roseisolibacter sp. H3M3-2]
MATPAAPDRARVEALFDALLDREPGDWRGWLTEQCGDPAVRAEVAALMRAHERAEGVLDAPAGDALSRLDARLEERLAAVGPYRIVREIGRGGMGTVYLAHRDDGQFARAVAVKVLRRGLDAEDVVRRFLAERQILASLEHPNIARLLDGGVAPDGRPYIVMEHVDGAPIDAWCDERRAPVAVRVRLVRDVARAVHAAHRALVVHRDLKPSNILVTDDGTVKLMDFGIAKSLDPLAGAHTAPLTRTGLRVMTPEYAAPEQVLGLPVTTATDVYGLGLVLYELLVGRRPQRPRDRSLHAIERAVCETEPPRPSAAAVRDDLARGEPTAAQLALRCGTTASRLGRQLGGDLDRIVARALHKAPDRRYPSAEGLALDLERHLDGRPVAARGDSMAYRARKFVVRHRWAVAAAAVIVVLLAGYAATVTVQASRVRRALAQALLEAEKAEQVTDFTLGLFEAVDGDAAARGGLTVRELLARGAARAERLDAQPGAQAQMLDVVGRVHQRLGDYAAAAPYLERALSLRRQTFGAAHDATAESMYHLAVLQAARGRYRPAEALYREALAAQVALHGEGHPRVARTRDGLGQLLQDRGDYAGAERLTRAALAARRAHHGPVHPDVAASLVHLSYQLQLQGRIAAAEAPTLEALAMRRRLFGESHADVASSTTALGLLRTQQGRLAEAESLQTVALALRRRLQGAEHPEVAQTLGLIAAVQRRQRRLAQAESTYHAAIALTRRALGDEHPDVAHATNGLALTLRDQGRLAEADSVQRVVLALRRRILGDDHPAVAMTLHQLGVLQQRRGRPDAGVPLLERALTIRRGVLGVTHPLTLESARELAALKRVAGGG